MKVARVLLLMVLTMLCFLKTSNAQAFIFINEILADPASGLAGDANGDGIRSSSDDEFIEIRNSGESAIDLTGWSITDAVSKRHIFGQGTFINPQAYIVVFGGGVINALQVHWQSSSSGSLSLNNDGDTVSLLDAQDQLIDHVIYGALAGRDESIVRFPEEPGSDFVLHSTVSETGALFSPGDSTNPIGGTNTVPEPSTLATFLLAGTGWFIKRTGRFS